MTTLWRLSRRGTFWSASAVLALCLWASGAPSVLYPVYAAEWHLPAVVTTSVFGTYPLALLIVLLFFGGLSDSIGRRRAMLLGIALIAIAALAFAFAPNVGWLYLGRLLQGVGTGFALGAASAALVAYSVGAIFLSLGSQMARDFTGTTNLLVVGALLGISSVAIGVTALFLGTVPAHVTIVIGGVVSLAGLGLMAGAAATGSIGLFLAWCVVGGVGYSFAFTGGLGLVNKAAPAHHRGATLSMLYLFSYLLQALTAIGAGALATAVGLGPAVDILAPVVGVLAAGAVVFAVLDLAAGRRRASALSASAVQTRA